MHMHKLTPYVGERVRSWNVWEEVTKKLEKHVEETKQL